MRGLIALTCFWSAKIKSTQTTCFSLLVLCLCFLTRSSGPALHQKRSRYVAACWSTPPLPAWHPWRPAPILSSMNYGTQTSSYQTGERNLHSSISPLKVASFKKQHWEKCSFVITQVTRSQKWKSPSREKVRWICKQLSIAERGRGHGELGYGIFRCLVPLIQISCRAGRVVTAGLHEGGLRLQFDICSLDGSFVWHTTDHGG